MCPESLTHDAIVLYFRIVSEIDEQAEAVAGCIEVVMHLSTMFDCLSQDFADQLAFDVG